MALQQPTRETYTNLANRAYYLSKRQREYIYDVYELHLSKQKTKKKQNLSDALRLLLNMGIQAYEADPRHKKFLRWQAERDAAQEQGQADTSTLELSSDTPADEYQHTTEPHAPQPGKNKPDTITVDNLADFL